MTKNLGIPMKLLQEASGHVVTVELKTGELYRGNMIDCDDHWNCQLETITYTAKDGETSQLEHVFIRGSQVRFMVIPDMLKNAPMFRRLDARIKGKNVSLGVGRGRAIAIRAMARAAASGAAGSGASGSGAAGSGASGSGAAGSGAARRGTAGRGAAGSGASGSGAAGSGASGSGAAGSGAAGRGTAGSGAAGRGTAGRGAAGRGAAPGRGEPPLRR